MLTVRSVLVRRLAPFKYAVQATVQSASISSSANRRQSKLIVQSRAQADVDIPRQSLVDFVWKDVSKWKDKPFMTCGVSGETVTFQEAHRLIDAFARFFIGELNLQKGDVVTLIGFNSPLYGILAHGALKAGLTLSFINPIYTNDEIIYQLGKANAKVVIADTETLPRLKPAVEQQLPRLRALLPLDDSLRALAEKAATTEGIVLPCASADDIAALPFSSGTTGLPKAVVLPHSALSSNILMFNHPDIRLGGETTESSQDIFFNLTPLFHIYGFQVGLQNTAMTGQHLLTIPKFTSETFIKVLRKYRPNGVVAVPPVIHMMVTHPEIKREDLSCINYVMTGAAALAASYMSALQDKAGRSIDIRQGYGLTETCAPSIFVPKGSPPSKAGSIGQVLPGSRARVMDLKTGQDLGPNQHGEILLKGPHVMRGYLADEKATANTLDSEGWLHTGDVGYYDEDEFFYITDRTKDLIKVKAMQVSPAELESIIMEIPEVADVAVVGVPDDRSGELPFAFVAPKPGKTIDPNTIVNHVKPRVAPYKQLSGVRILEKLPRNPTGKIIRKDLKNSAK